jgi:hypothetical protein
MKINTRFVIFLGISALSLMIGSATLFAQTQSQNQVPFLQILPHFEEGTLAVLENQYQVGTGGTNFSFVTQGGEDVLYAYQRYSVDVVLAGKNHITFLYQPLTLNSHTVVDRNGSGTGNLVVDGTSFAPQTPLDVTYGFDFWRLSYLYDFSNDPATILGLGLSLQIRNASIVFAAVDGSQSSISQNIGPVPIVKAHLAHWFAPQFGLDFEGDGFYASSAFFNGATQPFTGWIWDAALSAKSRIMPNVEAYLTVRSIGGGASGNNAYSYTSATTPTAGSPTFNSLATVAVALGADLVL